jgi:alpha-glucosidase
MFVHAPFDLGTLRDLVERAEAGLPNGATPCWTLGNHDVSRYPTRWAGGDPAKARAALVLLLGLRGTAVLYYGDELALPDTPVPAERLLDPVSIRYQPYVSRDAARTPMPWTGAPGAGFTAAGVEPWLPFGDLAGANVEEERRDPGSALHLTRDLLALRRQLPALHHGAYATRPAPDRVWAWQRGDDVVVAINGGDAPATVEGPRGTLRLGTERGRDGETVDGTLRLAPWEAAVVELD